MEQVWVSVALSPDVALAAEQRALAEQCSVGDWVAGLIRDAVDNARPAGAPAPSGLVLRPVLHVATVETAAPYFAALGGTIDDASRIGDWAVARFGAAELGLLGHPPADDAVGLLELAFETAADLAGWERRLREAGVEIARPATVTGFGAQLQARGPDGLLVKVNQSEPDLYR